MITIEEYLLQIIASLVAIALLLIAKFVTRKLIKKYAQLLHKPELRAMQMKQVTNIMLYLLFFFIIAAIWGLEAHNLLIGLSSIFAVIGVAMFAQWSILSNITAGIIMFFSAPYSIGDHIRIIDKDLPIEATIEKIETFYTHIRTLEDELIVLPNNLFLQKIISVKDV
ncbi:MULTISPECIES: mechanosensitive ion channel domain-containing protein [unclassified Parabacteroides]|uniref:mechanosensitive ion channel domain-containing protein n=1 Tax=unclassified Parabacteroides TaxID=2649774 RepID=UPI0024735C19|nr:MULTISPECIES: mechanosensitive ion channel domain-containing protein [unclassified Parabacteroides]